jgi:ABC-2 type transport system ATP-binding protein
MPGTSGVVVDTIDYTIYSFYTPYRNTEVADMLEATGLVKRYGPVRVLDGFTLSVVPGEITGLVGHNGAGKTTFTRIVAGLTAPDAGQVTIGGLPPRRAARLIGVAPQEISLYPAVTVRESLRLSGGLHGLRRRQLAAAIGEVTDALCLDGFLDQRIASLSGGQQRRAQAAVALLHRPPLLLLDEPTAGVDPDTRRALLAALRQRAADGAAILYTTHYLPELTDLQATLALARGGRVIARGTARQLLSGLPGQVTVDLGDQVLRVSATDTAATLAQLLTTISRPLRGVSVTEPSLDDLYQAVAHAA